MTKTWRLEEAKTHFSQLIRDAEQEPQIILRHGKPVAVVSPLSADTSPLRQTSGMTALQGLRGNFDFSDLQDDDWLDRDRRPDNRALEW